MNNEIMLVDENYINTMLEIIQDKNDFNLFSGSYLAPIYTNNKLVYIAVDNTTGCDFIVETFNTQKGATDWLNSTLERYDKQCEQFDNIHSSGGMTVTFNTNTNPHHMLESVLGYCDDYYSVFEQFDEDEFQHQRTFFDEWFQVYSPNFESEPYFNVLISGNTMRIEPF